jgi:ornithine cyclodeaminase
MPILLGDDDLQRLLPPERALSLVRAAVIDLDRGRLVEPPRVAADVGAGHLTFTCGAVPGSWVGYRSYRAPGDAGDEQVVVVTDDPSGRVRALYAGQHLGPLRTGALGALAIDALAPLGPVSLAVVGAGRQAWAQLRAIHAARRIESLRVHSRTPAHRQSLADRASAELGVPALAGDTARAAVEGADVVVLATSSPVPVVEAAWLAAASVVSTLGPKQVHRHEFPPALTAGASLLVTDSLAQLAAYDPPAVVVASGELDRVRSLGSVVAGGPARRGSGPAVFLSVGLAGTEAYLLEAITR